MRPGGNIVLGVPALEEQARLAYKLRYFRQDQLDPDRLKITKQVGHIAWKRRSDELVLPKDGIWNTQSSQKKSEQLPVRQAEDLNDPPQLACPESRQRQVQQVLLLEL